jgi:hypothetical protein
MPPHYKNKLLMDIVQDILPISTTDWEQVSIQYFSRSQESSQRSVEDLKRQWKEKLCNKGIKPTGKAGDGKDQIFAAQNIEKLIFQKKNVGCNGDSSSEGEDEDEDDDEDEDEDEDDIGNEREDEGNLNLDLENELFGPGPVTVSSASGTGAPTQAVKKGNNKRRSESSTVATPGLAPKTKNSRNSGGSRQGAGQALQEMGKAMSSLANSSNVEALIDRFSQQSQLQTQQFYAQIQAQQAQTNNMFMMLMMMNNRSGTNDDRTNEMMRVFAGAQQTLPVFPLQARAPEPSSSSSSSGLSDQARLI